MNIQLKLQTLIQQKLGSDGKDDDSSDDDAGSSYKTYELEGEALNNFLYCVLLNYSIIMVNHCMYVWHTYIFVCPFK